MNWYFCEIAASAAVCVYLTQLPVADHLNNNYSNYGKQIMARFRYFYRAASMQGGLAMSKMSIRLFCGLVCLSSA